MDMRYRYVSYFTVTEGNPGEALTLIKVIGIAIEAYTTGRLNGALNGLAGRLERSVKRTGKERG